MKRSPEAATLRFSGFTANSTKKSEWLAKDRIQAVLTSFNECKAHNTLFEPTR
jgi:hypothetical protein